jgi:selenocysteine lyase/cysteine desulfurase
VRILTSFDPAQSCGLANISLEGLDPAKVAAHLFATRRIIVTPIVHKEFQGLRITPNVYTTLQEIDIFCEAMEEIIRKGLAA